MGTAYAGGGLGTVFVTWAALALLGPLTAAAGAEETSGRGSADVAPRGLLRLRNRIAELSAAGTGHDPRAGRRT